MGECFIGSIRERRETNAVGKGNQYANEAVENGEDD